MRDALNRTGRPILFSMCEWGVADAWQWAAPVGNSWRTTGDIDASWDSLLANLDNTVGLARFAGAGGWNDPDMLEVDQGGGPCLQRAEAGCQGVGGMQGRLPGTVQSLPLWPCPCTPALACQPGPWHAPPHLPLTPASLPWWLAVCLCPAPRWAWAISPSMSSAPTLRCGPCSSPRCSSAPTCAASPPTAWRCSRRGR